MSEQKKGNGIQVYYTHDHQQKIKLMKNNAIINKKEDRNCKIYKKTIL